MRIFRLPSCTAFGARLLAAVLLGLTVLGGPDCLFVDRLRLGRD